MHCVVRSDCWKKAAKASIECRCPMPAYFEGKSGPDMLTSRSSLRDQTQTFNLATARAKIELLRGLR
jgi:hypothetical protein